MNQGGTVSKETFCPHRLDGDGGHFHAFCRAAIRNHPAEFIVNANDSLLGLGHQPLLDRCIILHCPMPVDMIRRQVEMNANARRQRRREIDLERGALDHVDAVIGRRLQREDCRANIAAHLHVAARLAQDMRNERRRGGFSVGAGDGHEGCVRRDLGALAAEQLDIADDLDARLFRELR